MGYAMTETLKMTLGKVGLASSLTTVQKAAVFRRAMEGMRDHMKQVNVGY